MSIEDNNLPGEKTGGAAQKMPVRAVEVRMVEGVLKTTSLNIAEVFGKGHKDVLRAIERLDCSEEFSRRNFAPSDYLDERGKTQPMYELTKNGTAFLVMGFTGRQAARFKEAYIAEFDRLERLARGRAGTEEPSDADLREQWRFERRWRERFQLETEKLRHELLGVYRQLHGPKH